MIHLSNDDLNNPKLMDDLRDIMDEQQDWWNREILEIQEEKKVDEQYASAIWYLRTRSRWTQACEDKLVNMCHLGEECPNMNEWSEE